MGWGGTAGSAQKIFFARGLYLYFCLHDGSWSRGDFAHFRYPKVFGVDFCMAVPASLLGLNNVLS
jgi:hypothetical protein